MFEWCSVVMAKSCGGGMSRCIHVWVVGICSGSKSDEEMSVDLVSSHLMLCIFSFFFFLCISASIAHAERLSVSCMRDFVIC